METMLEAFFSTMGFMGMVILCIYAVAFIYVGIDRLIKLIFKK